MIKAAILIAVIVGVLILFAIDDLVKGDECDISVHFDK